jgi:hypothetical protein
MFANRKGFRFVCKADKMYSYPDASIASYLVSIVSIGKDRETYFKCKVLSAGGKEDETDMVERSGCISGILAQFL